MDSRVILIANLFLERAAFFLNKIFFFNVFPVDKIEIPFIVAWLLLASVYFLIRSGSWRIKFLIMSFKYGLSKRVSMFQTLLVKKSSVKNLQTSRHIALFSVGSNVDLGSIFGTAMVVAKFGSGVIFWMLITSILATSIRTIEVFVTMKCRSIHNNKISGGPVLYILKALEKVDLPHVGRVAAGVFGFSLIASTFCSPQVNQTVMTIIHFSGIPQSWSWILSFFVAILIVLTIRIGFTKMSRFISVVTSSMSYFFLLSSFLIIIVNRQNLFSSLYEILFNAFSLKAGIAGIITMICIAAQRMFFCTEVGMGSSAISHANTINKDSISESVIAAITPILSISIVSICSGLVVVVTKSYLNTTDGISMLGTAFGTVHPLFPYLLVLVIPSFGYSTATSWGYYGQKLWTDRFGERHAMKYDIMLFIAYWICGSSTDFKSVLNVADAVNLSISIPNIIALCIIGHFYLDELKIFMRLPIAKMDQYMKKALL